MNDQSAVLDIAPKDYPEIEEKLTTKNAMSTVFNRLSAIEGKAQNLNQEIQFLRKTLKEFLDE